MTRPVAHHSGIRSQLARWSAQWDQFWFTPRMPETLGVLRITTGCFLLYSHLVLAASLSDFLGDQAWINNHTAQALHDGTFGTTDFARSYLWHLENPLLLRIHHGFTILVTAAFTVGLLTRLTAPIAWFLQLMYLHRLTGALFGFDQIITYAAMYLMIAPCGSCFSVDAILRRRRNSPPSTAKFQWLFPDSTPTVSANVATRLLQLHLCVIYLFGGLAKARGESWWDGTAIWYSVGNYEYQSIDMTWLIAFPILFTAMSHVTMFWEIFYCALIWPRITRPLTLAMAVAVHGGIALSLGMITFGLAMIAANFVFVEPATVRRWFRLGDNDEATARPDADRQDPTDPATQDQIPGGPAETPAQRSQWEAEHNRREAALEAKETQVRAAHRRINQRRHKLKTREAKYRDRVQRLKEREGKIKSLLQRRRDAQTSQDSASQDSASQDSDSEPT